MITCADSYQESLARIRGSREPYTNTQNRGPVTGEDLDQVVLVDAAGHPSGRMDRMEVHGPETPRHLAFSLYIFNDAHKLLLTRRALNKRTWPGVWTNSCCGHPRPGEQIHDAVRRRALEELGLTIPTPSLVLPSFSYRATDASGTVENELCPVFAATLRPTKRPLPNKDEVMDWVWVQPSAVATAMSAAPFAFSPWSVLQMEDPDAGALRGADMGRIEP